MCWWRFDAADAGITGKYRTDGFLIRRPSLEELENNFDFIRDCLKECWAEDPETRPDFKTIRTKLRPMRKGM